MFWPATTCCPVCTVIAERWQYQTVTCGETCKMIIVPNAALRASSRIVPFWIARTGVPDGATKSKPVWRENQCDPRSPNLAPTW